MAKSFNNLKAHKLSLYDYFTSGKYMSCRVDSIVKHDPDYLLFLYSKQFPIDSHVIALAKYELELLSNKRIAYLEATDNYDMGPFEDIPF